MGLSCGALLFIFSGAYKDLLISPIDLTIVMAVIAIALALCHRREVAEVARVALFWFIVAVTAWFAIRVMPSHSSWGIRKLTETIVLGGPAFILGYLISRSAARVAVLCKTIAFSCVPISGFVVFQSAVGNPYSFSSLGSAGYQMTGSILAMGILASCFLRYHGLFAISFLGLVVTGNMSGAVFGIFAVLLMWFIRSDWKATAKELISSTAVIALYWMLVAPPLFFMRLIWKLGALALQVSDMGDILPEQSAGALGGLGLFGRSLSGLMTVMPEESQAYLVDASSADRVDYFRDAIYAIMQSPLFGQGYGVPTYAGEAYPHNGLLEAFAEGGVIAFLLLLCVLVSGLVGALRSRNTFVVGIVTVSLLTMMVSGYWGGRSLLFALGMAAGASHWAQMRSCASSKAAAQ